MTGGHPQPGGVAPGVLHGRPLEPSLAGGGGPGKVFTSLLTAYLDRLTFTYVPTYVYQYIRPLRTTRSFPFKGQQHSYTSGVSGGGHLCSKVIEKVVKKYCQGQQNFGF